MGPLLFVLYLIVFCVLIPRISFFKKSGIGGKWLIVLFLARVGVALIHVYVDVNILGSSDSIRMHQAALAQADFLKAHPIDFFIDIFKSQYGSHYGEVFGTHQSYWNNLKLNFLLKVLAVFDLFSFSYFLVNTLFFNLLVFTGSVALYRGLVNRIQTNRWLLIVGVFLFPSGLYFTSAILRDGLLWLALGFIVWILNKMSDRGFSWKRIAVLLLWLCFVFIFRNYVTFVLVPALVAYFLAEKFSWPSFWVFPGTFVLSGILFFTLRFIWPQADFPAILVSRLTAFNEISQGSNTYLPLPTLTSSAGSYWHALPTVLNHIFWRPFVGSCEKLELPFAIELIVMQLIFLMWVLKRKQKSPALIHFLLFISIANLLLIGYTIPNLGAILRYRSLYFNFLFIIFLSGIDGKYFGRIFNIKNKNI